MAGVLLLTGCASSGPAPDPGVPAELRQWLLPPLEGYPAAVPTSARLELQQAYRDLVGANAREGARSAAQAALALDPELVPAHVLLAQVDFLEGRSREVVERLAPLLSDLPGYAAGQVLLAHDAETEGDVVLAYQSYLGLADSSALARRRAEDLKPHALQAVQFRFEEAVAHNRLEEAVDWLALLSQWRPDADDTLRAESLLAAATGDRERELALVRALIERVDRGEPSRELLERRAELEVRHGEARVGLELYRALSERYPDDLELQQRVEEATFRWRLERLPAEVVGLATKAELTRGDLATLLFWLLPNLRSSPHESGRIASDVLEHPQREAIVRVLNYGIMDSSDATLRRFAPDEPGKRRDLLSSLLIAVQQFGAAPCAEGVPKQHPIATETLCGAALRCGLILDSAECLEGARLSGDEALETIRRALGLLSEP